MVIDWSDDGDVSYSCTCPYARDTGPCKHCWATLLEADARGFALPEPDEAVVPGVFDDHDDADDLDPFATELTPGTAAPTTMPATRTTTQLGSLAFPPPPWSAFSTTPAVRCS